MDRAAKRVNVTAYLTSVRTTLPASETFSQHKSSPIFYVVLFSPARTLFSHQFRFNSL